MNRKNNWWLCSDISEVPILMATKFPSTVMVLGVVSNEGYVMPPHFVGKGLKVNAKECMKVLPDVVKLWMNRVAAGCHYDFQQDGAPAHNSELAQDWCAANLPAFWPRIGVRPTCRRSGLRKFGHPAALIVIPWIIYYIWSVCERDVKKPLTTLPLADGQDHGGDGHPPEDHCGKGLQAFLPAHRGRGEG